MNPDEADRSFELRRFPELRGPMAKMLLCYLVVIALKHWLVALGIVGFVLVYRFWRLRRPADCMRLSDHEICMPAGWFQTLKISKRQVEEVSPSSKGVIIAWKKAGVPHYTPVSSGWFEDAVWRRACPALLAWGSARA